MTFEALVRRVSNLVTRAFHLGTDNSTPVPTVTLDGAYGERLDQVERFEHYGFTSTPKGATDMVMLRFGAHPDHPCVVAETSTAYRPTDVPSGGTCLFDSNGSKVLLNPDTGEITVSTSGASVTVGASEVAVSAPKIGLGGAWDAPGMYPVALIVAGAPSASGSIYARQV